MNQALIDQIVSNVLAQLQPAAARKIEQATRSVPAATPLVVPARAAVSTPAAPVQLPSTAVPSSPQTAVAATPKPAYIELLAPVITADLLESAVRGGQPLRIGRTSILTPSARDWLHTKRTVWTRQDRTGVASGSAGSSKGRWHLILQTVTPTVRTLHDGLRRLSEGWKVELVGQPIEAATLASSWIGTGECDGVVVFTEQAELVACKANRNERIRAAVMQNSKQWELVTRTLSANVVCISPVGRTFIELRNLLRDCAATRPSAPAGI